MTVPILAARLPGVFDSQCLSEDSRLFSDEVENTEVGHLFEHILLEFLAEIKFYREEKAVVFSGITKWNWREFRRGSFLITINVPKSDGPILDLALRKSVKLLDEILASY